MNVVKLTRWWRWQGEGDKVKVTWWRWQGAEGPQTNCLLRCPPLQFDASRISRKDWEATRWGGNCPQISGWGERLKDLRIWWDKSDEEDSWDEYEEDDMMTINTHTHKHNVQCVSLRMKKGLTCRPQTNCSGRVSASSSQPCNPMHPASSGRMQGGLLARDGLDHHRMILIVIS